MAAFSRTLMHILHLVIICIIAQLADSSTLCNAVNEEIQKDRLATKTSYFNALKNESYVEALQIESGKCTPIKVWFITRHGTRYPAKSDIASFDKLPEISELILLNHFHGRGCLTEDDVFEFKRWIPPYDPRDKGQLQETGVEELYSMGEQWRDLYPNIFGEPFNSTKIKVEFTIRNRTGQSAYHFLRGMYGDEAIGKIELPEPYEPNFILRFYKACPLWMRDVYRNNETTYKERNLFVKTKMFQDMLHAVSYRLGFLEPLTIDYLTTMYDECRYETAWFLDRKSIWCKPFSQQDIEVLEYYQDLKYYYEDSYGTLLNKEIACKTISDLYIHLKDKVENQWSYPNGVLYFTHDKAIMKIQALLGLFQPQYDLKHDNLDPSRKFRTSLVAPFASSLGFVLYRCKENNEKDSYKVAMLFEGYPLPLGTICPTVLCPWERYEAFFKSIYKNCDLNKLCRLHDEL